MKNTRNDSPYYLRTILDTCQKDLESQNISCNRVSFDELRFETAGAEVTLTFEKKDDEFIQLVVITSLASKHIDSSSLLEIINDVNRQIKEVKGFLSDSGTIIFSVEILLNPVSHFTRLFERHLAVAIEGIHLFTQRLAVHQEKC